MNLGLKSLDIKGVLEVLLYNKNDKCVEKVKPTPVPAVKQTSDTYRRISEIHTIFAA